MRLMEGFAYSQMMYVVTELHVPDLLNEKNLSSKEIALRCGAKEDAIRRIMRCLVQVGLFVEYKDGTFGNNSLSKVLVSDHPSCSKEMVCQWMDQSYPSYAHLLEATTNGGNGFRRAWGRSMWEVYETDQKRAERFAKTMSAVQKMTTPAIVDAYDWKGITKVADIGGSLGTLLSAILHSHSKLEGVLFDLPNVIAKAETIPVWRIGDLASRTTLVPGNFFESVPVVADVYVLRMILHDWDDDQCIHILKNIRKSIRPGGKVLICDVVLPNIGEIQDDMVHSMFVDAEMLAVTDGGKERTEPEFSALFNQSGFRLTRIIPTKSFLSIIEGVVV